MRIDLVALSSGIRSLEIPSFSDTTNSVRLEVRTPCGVRAAEGDLQLQNILITLIATFRTFFDAVLQCIQETYVLMSLVWHSSVCRGGASFRALFG